MASLTKIGRYYYVMYWRGKRQHKFSTKSGNKEIAEQVRRRVEDELAAEKYGLESIAPIEISLDDFLSEALTYAEGAKATNTSILYHQVSRDFVRYVGGNKTLAKITVKTVIEWCSSASKAGRKASTINKYLSVMQAIFTMAEKLHYTSTNPFKDAPRYAEGKLTPRFLSPEEAERLLAGLRHTPIITSIHLALFAGLRLSETMNLKWRDIDFANKNLHVVGKGNKGRTVPMPERLIEHLLAVHKTAQSINVCRGNPSRSWLSTGFVRSARKIGLPGITFHTLRHTFASWLVQRGAPLVVVQQLLGHNTISTTMIYSHIDMQDKRRAVAMLD